MPIIDEFVGPNSGKAPKNPWSICQIAMPAVSVVFAVLLIFNELKVPFKNVSAGCELGCTCSGV
jgi:hypothetical protein